MNTAWPSRVQYGDDRLTNVTSQITAKISHGKYWWDIEFNGNIGDSLCSISFGPLLLDVSDWTHLSDVTVEWNAPINPVNNDHWGGTYHYTHSLINSARIEFKKRHGNHFLIRATGVDEADVSFLIDAPATFEFVEINSLDPETKDGLTRKLSNYLNTSNLTPGELTIQDGYDDGRVYTCLKFAPFTDNQ